MERAQLSGSNPVEWLIKPFEDLMQGASLAGQNADPEGAMHSRDSGAAAAPLSLGSTDWWGANLLTPMVSQQQPEKAGQLQPMPALDSQQVGAAARGGSEIGSASNRDEVIDAFRAGMHGSDGESMSDQESLQASSARGWEEAESISDISRAGVDYAKYADELEAEEACGLIGRDGHPLPFATDAYMNNRKKENKIFFVDDMQLYHERENLPLVPYESLQFRHVMGAPGWQPGGRFAHHHDSDHLVASMQKREKREAKQKRIAAKEAAKALQEHLHQREQLLSQGVLPTRFGKEAAQAREVRAKQDEDAVEIKHRGFVTLTRSQLVDQSRDQMMFDLDEVRKRHNLAKNHKLKMLFYSREATLKHCKSTKREWDVIGQRETPSNEGATLYLG